MRVSRAEFEALAERALAEIPAGFRALLTDLAIDVKALPGPEAGERRGSRGLLGLYKGLRRHEMASPLHGAHLPARIVLYQRNIEDLCATRAELARQVRLTLRHELAHHLGFSDEDLRRRWPEGA